MIFLMLYFLNDCILLRIMLFDFILIKLNIIGGINWDKVGD